MLNRIIKKDVFQGALIVGVVLFLSYQNVIFGDKTLLSSAVSSPVLPPGTLSYAYADPGSASWEFEPNIELVKDSFLKGDFPLWNPYNGLGLPFAAELQPAIYYPLQIILFVNSNFTGWDIFLLCRIFLAGFFMYLFLREINLSKLGSTTGAITFMLCGYLTFYISIFHLNIDVLFPLIFLVFEKFIKQPSRRNFLWIVGAMVIVTTGGSPEPPLILFLLAYPYYFLRVLTTKPETLWFYVKKAITFTIVALLISAIYILPFLEYAPLSYNIHSTAVGTNAIHIKNLVGLISPFFYGLLSPTREWLNTPTRAEMGYIGIVPIILVLSSFWMMNKTKYVKSIYWFFLISAFLILSKVFGLIFINWIGYLPLLNQTIFVKYYQPGFALCIAVIIGITLDQIKSIPLKRISIPAFLILTIVALYFNEYYEVIKTAGALSHVIKWVTFATAIILTFCLGYIIFFKIRSAKYLSYFVFTILLLELLTYNYALGASRGTAREQVFPGYSFIKFLQNDDSVYRIIGKDSILYPDTSIPYELQDIRALAAMYPVEYDNIVHLLAPNAYTRLTGDANENLDLYSPLLDLLNVKYLLAKNIPAPPTNKSRDLANYILTNDKIISPQKMVGEPDITVDNITKHTLFEHAPTQIETDLLIPPKTPILKFSLTLNPGLFESQCGNGVTFIVWQKQTDGRLKSLFEKSIDPVNNPSDRHWHDERIDLSDLVNQQITLIFETQDRGDNACDQAYWGDIHLTEMIESKVDDKYELVYDDEIKIFKNKQVYPRSFIVHDYEIVTDENKILEILKENINFDLRNSIILEKDPRIKIDLSPVNTAEKVSITSYQPREVTIQAQLVTDGFLVLSDQYYPGWKAYLDGQETEIYKTDYVLRSIYVPAGQHEIKFIYKPASFKLGMTLSIIGIIAFLIYLKTLK